MELKYKAVLQNCHGNLPSKAQLLLIILATVMMMRMHNVEEEMVRKHEPIDIFF